MTSKKIIYVDMDDVICDFVSGFREAKKQGTDIEYPQSIEGFWRGLTPIPGAIDAVNLLNNQNQFDLYFLTAPSIMNPNCYSEKRQWIEDYFGMDLVNKLIISPNKGLSKGDYLIDDMDRGKGQEFFEGQLLKFGSSDYPNWDRVLNYFSQTYKIPLG